MSYGTPENMESIEAYYTHIRRGRPPEPEQLKELTDRYEAIVGGYSHFGKTRIIKLRLFKRR